MNNIAIVTDSVASIPEPITQELNIHCVPYYIHCENQTFRDNTDIDHDSFYKSLIQAKNLPKTAYPSPSDYELVYKDLFWKGFSKIISIHITSKGSGAYQAALLAKNNIAEKISALQIEVIDSLNVSMCQGWMAIEAARAAITGNDFATVIKLVKDMIPNTKMLQTADTLKYLYMGGRIGKAKHLVGSLLNIKPIISMEDGVIVSVGQVRSRNKAYSLMIEKIESSIGINGRIKIAYTHVDAISEILKLKDLIENRIIVVESLISELTPALGVHTGPGTAGLCYFPLFK